jgi:hypothetical protein
LDADLIGLHLPQVTRLLDQLLLHRFRVPPGGRDPILNGAPMQAKGNGGGRFGTAVSDQGDDQGNELLVVVFPIEGRPTPGTKGLAADGAAIASFDLAMNP